MYGWAGRVLRVDLSSGRVTVEGLSERLRLDFLGGRGINSRILYDEVRPGTDPLGPENRLIIGTSPLTGTGLFISGRCHATAKSPLTGILGDSNAGGHFGPELKWAGYDHVVFEGRAEGPVYLWIDDDRVEIRDASRLWGRTISETYAAIREELGDPRIQVAAIGPAGENLVSYATIMTGKGSAFGKTGMGTVMGSKRLKAVAVRGTKGVVVARPGRFRAIAKDLIEKIKGCVNYQGFSRYGTMGYLHYYDKIGRSIANNAQQVGQIPYIQNFSVESTERYITRSEACYGCPIHCKHEFHIKEGPFAGERGHGTEFCIMSAHGPSCGNQELAAVLEINKICNEYGICGDTSGIVLAAAFEWYQRGLIGKEDTDGIALEWGDHEAQIAMLRKIIRREGIGEILAEGTAAAARRIGRGAEKYISHSKGGDLDQCDVRSLKGCALSDAVSSRGADPQRGWPGHEVVARPLSPRKAKELFGTDQGVDPLSYEGKAAAVSYFSSLCALSDALGICKFGTKWTGSAVDLGEMAELFSAATGVEMDEAGLWRVAARIHNVERAFLVREGITRKDDTIHGRAMEEPVPTGPFKGERLDREKFSKMLDEYYDIMGWDRETGIPTRATLESLGLEDVADELERMGKY